MLKYIRALAPALLSLTLSAAPSSAQDGPPVDATFQHHIVTTNTFTPRGILRDVPVGIFYGRLFKSGNNTALCGAFSSPAFHERRNKIYLRGSKVLFAAHSVNDLRFFEDLISRQPSLAARWQGHAQALLSGRKPDLASLTKAAYGLPTTCKLVRGGGKMAWRDSSARTTLYFQISLTRSVRRKY
ncbi:hypothetical protein FHY55_08695 [Oceanicola sp. D3]|uniref:hypothetical protein n=1 Tax=Oceanicola sp. D3 TaxID=2587163 RepID=UPI00111CBC0D|nr:hypothetical protein [Oceanicola sp. D3]QDC09315.1 hypothetical protein FHY55_08695 [Oceanicola sp. D3]